MLEKLPPRERQLFEALCAHGEASAAEIGTLMEDAPGNSAIRSMLSRMEKKGFIRRRLVDKQYLYASALPGPKVKQSALRHLIETFFDGSPASAASAMLGMSKKLEPEELDQLEALIAKAREKGSK